LIDNDLNSKAGDHIMHILSKRPSMATQDGDGVKIRRVADFTGLALDPFLMIDELKSDDETDYIGGFPPHPHRGIETFTYILKGGFEHQDQMGNKKAIKAGDVQWMSTGYGVIHSEMPLADANDGMHGFQIWLNMPAKEKLRPARYRDTTEQPVPEFHLPTANLRVLAGEWLVDGHAYMGHLNELAGEGAIADLTLDANVVVDLDANQGEFLGVYVYHGSLWGAKQGDFLVLNSSEINNLETNNEGAGLLLFKGSPIKEKIAHMGPFVMNTQEELHQAVRDYQSGKFGSLSV
jgi:redox-sensitive bicupin YhaK (pirin superfamily)